ncbi:MAG: DNA repair protein RadC [Nitrospira sp.]|jgi:DNA repair protein RadC|nr:MAG: DNA repair protein RadC [Nitrospira sp.]
MSVDSSLGSSNGGRPLSPVRKYGIPRYRVALVREGRALPAAESVHTSEGAVAILRPLFEGLDREQFLICGLDAKHKLIGINVVSTGSLNLTIVHPREVFKPLILMNAGAWLCRVRMRPCSRILP